MKALYASLAVVASGLAPSVHADSVAPNAVPILIYWEGIPAPTKVFFETPTGEVMFDAMPDHFKGTRQTQTSWAFHAVVLGYDHNVSLALRTVRGTELIRITIPRISAAPCRYARIVELDRETARNSGSDRDRLGRMIEAQRLTGICPQVLVPLAAKAFFTANCNLAKRTDYIDLNKDAISAFVTNWPDRASAKQQAEACIAEVRAKVVPQLRRLHLAALEKKDGSAAGLRDEIVTLSSDPAWSGGFARAGIDADAIRADYLVETYAQQIEARDRGDLSTAIAINTELTAVKADADFSDAFRAVRVDDARLAKDRASFGPQ